MIKNTIDLGIELAGLNEKIDIYNKSMEAIKDKLIKYNRFKQECISDLSKAYNTILSEKYVGKCFKVSNLCHNDIKCFKIADFDKEYFKLICLMEYDRNKIISICNEILFDYSGNSTLINDYIEITEDEFNFEYNKYINELNSINFSNKFEPRTFSKGDVVAHFKRELLDEDNGKLSAKYLYLIRDIAVNTETDERMVIYASIEDPNKIYVRPYDMFCSEVDHEKYPNIKQKYRFAKIKMEGEFLFNRIDNIAEKLL